MPLGHAIDPPSPRSHGRVGIRLLKLDDAERLQTLLRTQRDWLRPWEATLPGAATATPGSTPMRPIIRSYRKQLRAGTGVPFAVTFDDVVVGQLSVSDISGGAVRSAQIGYWISRDMAGQGVTPTAVALTIDYLFDTMHLHRVEICIRPENHASIRVAEKLRLRHEGMRKSYIHIDGDWRDHVCFAITADEAPTTLTSRLN